MSWYNQSYRHSLASKGIRTSFALRKKIDVRDLQKTYQGADYLKGVQNRFEIKPIERGKLKTSGKARLLEEEAWLENALLDEELDLTPERRLEMMNSLAEIKDKLHHLPGAPPVGTIKRDIPLESFERYKGTSGRVPYFIHEITGHVDLTQPEIEREARYERLKMKLADERHAEKALKRIEDEILAGRFDEPITAEVTSEIRRGRVREPEPILMEEEDILARTFAAKRWPF